MKKLLIGAVSAFALSFVLAGSANAAPNFSQFCKDNNNFGLASHGDCVSVYSAFFNNGKGNNDAAALCKNIKDTDPAFFDANWKNVGQCVKAVAPLFPG
jgi:hypothetical protein